MPQIRDEIIWAYGGRCKCCGESEHDFLTIDHIRNDGKIERKKLHGMRGHQFYAYLKRLGFPKDNYRLLCFNCNQARNIFGNCPHERKRVRAQVGRELGWRWMRENTIAWG